MSNPSILIIDCEIINMIPDKKKPKIEGLTYCEGWHDFVGMGISVIGTYCCWLDSYTAFIEDVPLAMAKKGGGILDLELIDKIMGMYDIIAGFNCRSFDLRLMLAHGIYLPDMMSIYDIYVEVKKAARAGKFAPGYNLDSIAKANGLSCKTGHGEFAPKLWQEGKYQEVIDYCLQDVRITKEILDLIMAGKLRNPVRPDEILNVRKPGTES